MAKFEGVIKSEIIRLAKRELHLEEANPKMEATPEEMKASRLTPKRIQGLHKKLGISQRELGILIGASLGNVAMREKEKFKPKPDKKAALVAVRKLKKREMKKLHTEKAEESKKSKAEKKPAKKPRPKKKVPRKDSRLPGRGSNKMLPGNEYSGDQGGKLTGVFYMVEGLKFETQTGSGMTDESGEFIYRPGQIVKFSIGKLILGSASGSKLLTEAHLVPAVSGDVKMIKNQIVTNIARFVQSLDEDSDVENGVTISPQTARMVTEHKDAINFNQSEEDFAADANIVALFTKLNLSLRSAAQARNYLRRTLLGIQKMTDVPIPVRDGSYLLADIFRPIKEGQYPVVMSATSYGKAFRGFGCICSAQELLKKEKWEDDYFENVTTPKPTYEVVMTPNTVDWVPQGYVVMRIDPRGSCNTPGVFYPYSPQDAEDAYDAIEWAGQQTWSNGNVGLWGVSNSADIQWNIASLQPPHLKAMIPHSSESDQYRDIVYQGGIYYRDYRENWFKNMVAIKSLHCLDQPIVDILDIFENNPHDDPLVYGPYGHDPNTGERLPTGQISADLQKVTVPFWSHTRQDIWPVHIRGSNLVYIHAASQYKKLTVEAGDEFTRAWTDAVPLHIQFFDYWLKGINNGIMDLPSVTLEIRLPRDISHPNGWWKTRFENEWPLARTQYTKYYMDINAEGKGVMSLIPPSGERQTTYSADVYPNGVLLPCSGYGFSFLTDTLTEDMEIAGYMKIGMWVSSTSHDMDIFATLRVMDENNNEVFYHSQNSQPSPVMVGFLKVSHRKLDYEKSRIYLPYHTHLEADNQPLNPNEKVQVEVEIWPATAVIKKGHRIWLTIQPYEGCFAAKGGPHGVYLHDYDESYHKDAFNTIYTGGVEPSYLQLPIIPPE